MTFEIEDQKHAEQPRFCDSCYRKLLNGMSEGDAVHYPYCQHNKTQATVGVKGGKIVRWSLNGPISLEDAKELAARIEYGGAMVSPSPAVN